MHIFPHSFHVSSYFLQVVWLKEHTSEMGEVHNVGVSPALAI